MLTPGRIIFHSGGTEEPRLRGASESDTWKFSRICCRNFRACENNRSVPSSSVSACAITQRLRGFSEVGYQIMPNLLHNFLDLVQIILLLAP